jgi:ribose transport system substrate-binding protein
MRKNRKRVRAWQFLALLICAVLVLAAGCSKKAEAPAETKRYTIGFSNGFSGNSWRVMMLASLEQEVQKYDDVILTTVDGQNDNMKQVNDIQSLIAKKVDAIMVIPNSAPAIEPVLKEARQRGIKVAVFNIPVSDPEAYDFYIGTDIYSKGKAWGEWLNKKLDGKGKIVALGGLAGNAFTAEGFEGLKDAISGSQIEILAFKDTDWAEDRAKIVMTDLLSAYKQIDGVWADAGNCALGALKAMIDARRPLIPVTGNDYNGLLKFYEQYKGRESNLDFYLISEPTWESREALKMLYQLLKGETVPKDNVFLPDAIDKNNYSQFLKPELADALFLDTDLPVETLKNLF